MEDQFYVALRDVLDVDEKEFNTSDAFRDYEEWDSLANLSLIAMLDEEYGIIIPNEEFKQINTIGELIAEIKKRKG